MSRRPAVALAMLTVVAVGVAPATAATKHKPIKGSYTVNLIPDPTQDATQEAKPGASCAKIIPGSYDDHAFKVPAAGKLTVTLDSPSSMPTTPVGPDWDLWIFDSSGQLVDASHGATAHEETTDKFKKATGLVFEVCNLTGDTKGTVTYTFTYA